MTATARDRWVQVSPLLVLAVGHIAARLCAHSVGVWAWLPLMLVYWAVMLCIAWAAGALPGIASALRQPSGAGWWIANLLAGLLPWPILLRFHSLLRDPTLAVCWLLVAFLNPFFEEGYWRGLLGEATRTWPVWIACVYSSALFTLSHPLLWGVFSAVNRRLDAVLSLFATGLLWSATYRRRKSLQAPVVSHMLVDLGNLSVFAFMNLFSPTGWK